MEKQKLTVLAVEVSPEAAKFDLLSADETEVLELNIYRKTYENSEWVDNDEVTENFYKDIQDVFGVMSEDDLEGVVDSAVEVYVDEENGKAFIHEPKTLDLDKPKLEEVGELETGNIVEIHDFETKRLVIFETDEGKRRPVNFSFGKKNKKLDKYLVSKVDLVNKKKKFKKLTGHDWDYKEPVIGRKGTVEIKSFKFGGEEIPYIELKKLK